MSWRYHIFFQGAAREAVPASMHAKVESIVDQLNTLTDQMDTHLVPYVRIQQAYMVAHEYAYPSGGRTDNVQNIDFVFGAIRKEEQRLKKALQSDVQRYWKQVEKLGHFLEVVCESSMPDVLHYPWSEKNCTLEQIWVDTMGDPYCLEHGHMAWVMGFLRCDLTEWLSGRHVPTDLGAAMEARYEHVDWTLGGEVKPIPNDSIPTIADPLDYPFTPAYRTGKKRARVPLLDALDRRVEDWPACHEALIRKVWRPLTLYGLYRDLDTHAFDRWKASAIMPLYINLVGTVLKALDAAAAILRDQGQSVPRGSLVLDADRLDDRVQEPIEAWFASHPVVVWTLAHPEE